MTLSATSPVGNRVHTSTGGTEVTRVPGRSGEVVPRHDEDSLERECV